MKPLLASACGFALLISLAACDTAVKAPAEEAAVTSPPAAEIAATEIATRRTYTLAPGERDVSRLLGAAVHNSSGEEIGQVSDIWLATDGKLPMLIVREGGVAGVGGQLYSLAYVSAAVSNPTMPGDDANVIVNLTEKTLQTLPKFEQASMNDHRLASEMIGTTAKINGTADSARIDDLILATTGEARYAVISQDITRDDKILVDYSHIVLDPATSDSDVTLDLTTQTLADAPAYKRQ